MIIYLSIIAISAILICALNIGIGTAFFGYAWWFVIVMVLVSTLAVILVDALFAWIPTKLPASFYKSDKGIFTTHKWQTRLYEKLGIKKWKDKVWELGKLNGFSKASVEIPSDPAYFDRFILESKIGLLCHLLGSIFGFLIIFIFPLKYALVIGIPVAAVNVLINSMSYMILKYNLPKLRVAKMRAERLAIRAQQKGDLDE